MSLSTDSPTDWGRVDAWFFHKKGRLPHEVDRMTLAEIAAVIDEPGPRPPGGDHVSNEEREAYAQRWKRMTLAEKLREGARELGVDV